MKKDCIIIGAGLAGIMAASVLQKASIDYLVLDKGRSIGGRMATRRVGNGKADHGAQFFTVRSEEMKTLVQQLEEKQWVTPWMNGFPLITNFDPIQIKAPNSPYTRYKSTTSMNHLTKQLAHSLSIQVNENVESIVRKDNYYELTTINQEQKEQRTYVTKSIILTAPVPQSLQLLESISLPTETKRILESITYDPCLVAIVEMDDQHTYDIDALKAQDNKVEFIVNHHKKGISDIPIFSIYSTPVFAQQHYDAPDPFIEKELLEKVKHLIPFEQIKSVQIKRWRYAKVKHGLSQKTLLCKNLIFAGDGLMNGTVEGAILSGLQAGNDSIRLLASN